MTQLFLRIIGFFCLAGYFSWPGSTALAHPLSDQVAVIYNVNDPDSKKIARFYANMREIPNNQIIGLDCSLLEIISRGDYEKTIRDPIKKIFDQLGFYSTRPALIQIAARTQKIRYIVLIRGIPLKIAEDPTQIYDERAPKHFRVNSSAVDSELCLLPLPNYPLMGVMPNIYYDAPYRFTGDLNEKLLIVTRLDGPTVSGVLDQIGDTIEAEKTGLAGRAYVDARGLESGPYATGDEWMKKAFASLQSSGFETVLDNGPNLFPSWYPMQDTALYVGWYSQDMSGPFRRPDFKFQRGAIAYHLHSFSAMTLRDSDRYWCGPLLSRGVVATMGAVNEPFLHFTPNVGIFVDRLVNGYNFGEAAYASQQFLSWQITFIGDPLYTPFPVENLDEKIAKLKKNRNPNLVWAQLKKINLLVDKKQYKDAFNYIHDNLNETPHPYIIEKQAEILYRMGDYQQARPAYWQLWPFMKDSWQKVRVARKVIEMALTDKDTPDAARMANQLLLDFPQYPGREELKKEMSEWTNTTDPKVSGP
ncbi:MAG: TIGR03790 family protein [Verrucomicrobiota bacterium]|nr:TIGR03790 family protein [Verrucomicrobiota bacterium]